MGKLKVRYIGRGIALHQRKPHVLADWWIDRPPEWYKDVVEVGDATAYNLEPSLPQQHDIAPNTKRCNRCGQTMLMTSEFWNTSAWASDGWSLLCKPCRELYNQENAAAVAKALSEQAANWRAKNPGAARISVAIWRQNNPSRAKAFSRRRRVRKAALPGTLTPAQWQRAKDYFGNCCAVCGRPVGLWHTLAMDHWIPICPAYKLTQPNPGTVAWNIVPLCQTQKDGEGSCNNSKRNKEPRQWLVEQLGQRKANAAYKRIMAYFEMVKQEEKQT
jgi:ribosomal protein S14